MMRLAHVDPGVYREVRYWLQLGHYQSSRRRSDFHPLRTLGDLRLPLKVKQLANQGSAFVLRPARESFIRLNELGLCLAAGRDAAMADYASLIRPTNTVGRESEEAGQKIRIGWIGTVRPSRRPLSRPPQDEEFTQCHQRLILILRSAQRARLEGRQVILQPVVSILAQPRSVSRRLRVTTILDFRTPHKFHCFSIDRAVQIR
jgi:hypothetical protein